jgi:hypothetical protein
LDELEGKVSRNRCVSKVNLGVQLACFQSALHRPLLAPIYRWPGLEDRVGFDTDYKYRHTVITRIRLSLQLGLAQRASGVLN